MDKIPLGWGRDNAKQLEKSDIPDLIKSLRDQSPEVRAAAMSALGSFNGSAKSAVPALLVLSKSNVVTDRQHSAYALSRIAPNDDKVVDTFFVLLRDTNYYVINAAANSLGKVNEETAANRVVPGLIEIFSTGTGIEQYNATLAIRWLGPTASPTASVLVEALSSDNLEVRSGAYFALRAIGVSEAKSEGEKYRKNQGIIDGLSSKKGYSELVSDLKSDDLWTKYYAMYYLGQRHADKAEVIPLLLSIAWDEKEQRWFRRVAASALKEFDDPQAFETWVRFRDVLFDWKGGPEPNVEIDWTADKDLHIKLHNAIISGHVKKARFLIEKGVDINGRYADLTPLQRASVNGDSKFVRLLISHGADVNAVSEHGTAISLAQKNGFNDVVDLLRKAGAK